MYNSVMAAEGTPKSRIELGVQLEASVRYETLLELTKAKQFLLPGDGSLEALKEGLSLSAAADKEDFLELHRTIIAPFVGDLEAIERMALEFVEDKARLGVAYVEAKFCPHLFFPAVQDQIFTPPATLNGYNGVDVNEENKIATHVSPDSIVEAVLRGLKQGEEKYGTKVRLLMLMLWGNSEWRWDLLRLSKEFKNRGVVGIALAGSKIKKSERNDVLSAKFKEVFESAIEDGIHRTIQLYDSTPAHLEEVLNDYGAERLSNICGILKDSELLEMCIESKIHFEITPYSSLLRSTGKDDAAKGTAIAKLLENGASFSVSSDSPILTGKTIDDELQLVRTWGLNEAHQSKLSFQAVLHSFLGTTEKKELISILKQAFGIIDYVPAGDSLSPVRVVSPQSSPNATLKTGSRLSFMIASWEDRR